MRRFWRRQEGELRSPLGQSLSAGRCTCFPKTPAEVNLYGAAAPGEGGAPPLRARVRACARVKRNQPVASDCADDEDITNAVNLAPPPPRNR